MHSSISTSHFFPVYPAGQTHVNLLMPSTQVPEIIKTKNSSNLTCYDHCRQHGATLKEENWSKPVILALGQLNLQKITN